MVESLLALTAIDRLSGGLLGLLLCLVAFIIWLFIMIALGVVWRHLTRRNRRYAMQATIGVMCLATAVLFAGVPRASFERRSGGQRFEFARLHGVGLTWWFLRRTEYNVPPPPGSPALPVANRAAITTEISVVGIVALLPTLGALVLLARWQCRNLPGFYRRPYGRCDWCDYDLRGHHSANCPECGEGGMRCGHAHAR